MLTLCSQNYEFQGSCLDAIISFTSAASSFTVVSAGQLLRVYVMPESLFVVRPVLSYPE